MKSNRKTGRGESVYAQLFLAEPLERRSMLSTVLAGPVPTGVVVLPDDQGAKSELTVPVYQSNPNATARLELDFDGDYVPTWGGYTPGTIPAFDKDGDASTFSAYELQLIYETWQSVAEKYAPFNINVTTGVSGNLANKQVFKIDIGGSYSDWYGASAGGVAYLNGFSNGSPNIGFVFGAGGGFDAHNLAEAAGHEAGHGFGLNHQSTWVNGVKTEEYNTNGGSTLYVPSMGVSYYADRGLWWHGLNSNNVFQNDIEILSNATNGFGYRPDEPGTFAVPRVMGVNSNVFGAVGVISNTTNAYSSLDDTDYYQFTLTSPGVVTLKATGPTAGALLNAQVFLYDSAGTLITSSNNASTASPEWITYSLAAGTYKYSIQGVLEATLHSGDNVGAYQIYGSQITPLPIYTVAAGNSVTLDAGFAASYAASYGASFAWDFSYIPGNFSADAFGPSATYFAPSGAGGAISSVALRITDPAGHSSILTTQVRITGSAGYAISGKVYKDANGNGVFDTATETGLAGVPLYIDADNDSVKDPAETTITSVANGDYTFTGLPNGTYKVRQVLPAGYVQTTPTGNKGWEVILNNASMATRNFGNKPIVTAAGSIAGNVFKDGDGDGVKDAGETGLSGVVVYSDPNNNSKKDAGEATATTDTNGNYKLAGLAAGTYKIRQVTPAGYTQSLPTGGVGIQVTLASSTSAATGKHFGNKPATTANASISGIAFNDNNKNGKYDTGDTLAGGKTLWLDLDDDGTKDAGEKTVTSASDGKFSFTGLTARTYHVRRVFPGGYKESTPARYITLAAGQAAKDVYIGSRTA